MGWFTAGIDTRRKVIVTHSPRIRTRRTRTRTRRATTRTDEDEEDEDEEDEEDEEGEKEEDDDEDEDEGEVQPCLAARDDPHIWPPRSGKPLAWTLASAPGWPAVRGCL